MIIEVNSENETKVLGERLGKSLVGGEVFELVGDVGAGKTTFVKGLARGLGINEDVQSPSYTINRVYDGRDGIRLSHYDFYRLSDAGIMAEELREVVNDKTVVTVVEWADIIEGVLPDGHYTVRIQSPTETSRHIELNDTLAGAIR